MCFYCGKYLSCPSSHPMHEVFYYGNAAELGQHISASQRATMQKALAEPYLCIKVTMALLYCFYTYP